MKNGREKNLSLGIQAYEAIYRRIVTLEFEPGSRLEEGRLVELLGIGRTPIREAIQKLCADLLVESQSGKGYVVRPLTLQNTKAAFEALRVMELGVAELSVRFDPEPFLKNMSAANQLLSSVVKHMDIFRIVEANSSFHDDFARCSHNVYLVEGLRKIRCETNRLAYLSYGNEIDPGRNLQDHYASVIEQHEEIITAIEKRDESRLKRVIVEHIETFKNRIINYLMSF